MNVHPALDLHVVFMWREHEGGAAGQHSPSPEGMLEPLCHGRGWLGAAPWG